MEGRRVDEGKSKYISACVWVFVCDIYIYEDNEMQD